MAAGMGPTDEADDALGDLMRRTQAGDAETYTALLQAVAVRVRRTIRARRPGARPDQIEDLTQDVLLSVHHSRHTWDPARPFGPWLTALVRHRLADAARSYGRRGVHEVSTDDPSVTFVEPATNKEAGADPGLLGLEQAVRALPQGQRQAIELLKLQELSLKEASAATGLSTGALKVATHRAMTTLKRIMRGTDAVD